MSTEASSAEEGGGGPDVSGSNEASATEPTVVPTVWGLRRGVRVATKVGTILLGTSGLAMLLGIAWLPTVVVPGRGPRLRARIRQSAFRLWGKGMLFTLGVRVHTRGVRPTPGRMIVSNHLSYLDIATLSSLLPAVFVSKAEVKRWPFWGAMATMAGTIFIDRGRKRDTVRVLEEMALAFDRGDSVVVFPEATSTEGATILPFKSSLLAHAAEGGNPVEWMTVTYRAVEPGASARDHVCWWGDMGFLPHFMDLCSLRGVDATVTFGNAPISGDDRKDLAESLRATMLTEFTPVS